MRVHKFFSSPQNHPTIISQLARLVTSERGRESAWLVYRYYQFMVKTCLLWPREVNRAPWVDAGSRYTREVTRAPWVDAGNRYTWTDGEHRYSFVKPTRIQQPSFGKETKNKKIKNKIIFFYVFQQFFANELRWSIRPPWTEYEKARKDSENWPQVSPADA